MCDPLPIGVHGVRLVGATRLQLAEAMEALPPALCEALEASSWHAPGPLVALRASSATCCGLRHKCWHLTRVEDHA